MNTYADKISENKTQAIAHSLSEQPVRNALAVQFADNRPAAVAQQKIQQLVHNSPRLQKNKTGLPDQLKAGIENLSGISMDDTRVHYNSPQPAQLNAYAYAQGSNIHLAPGQEKHLPHEAWHVVQQKQGRVKATRQMKAGIGVNDDIGLEHEADVMGKKALESSATTNSTTVLNNGGTNNIDLVQGRFVHFNVHPPAQIADPNWIVKSAQVAGERPPFIQDTIDAIDARQPNLAWKHGEAIRHINPWGGMVADLVAKANNAVTIQQLGDELHTEWPATSTIHDPGLPHPIEEDALANYAESYLDARHNDPANLFWGNGAQNSGLGETYDNPTKAKKTGGVAGSVFSLEEKNALVAQHLTALTHLGPGDAMSSVQMLPVAIWIGNYLLSFPPANRQAFNKMEAEGTTFNKLVTLLSNVNVFKLIELTKVFRTPDTKTGQL